MVVVACNCTNCQRKTGSVLNVVSTFRDAQVISTKGEINNFTLSGDSGRKGNINFCPNCGVSVFWKAEVYENCTSIAVGCFADPGFPAPVVSLWNKSKHSWVNYPDTIPCMETQLTEEQVKLKLSESKNA